MHYFLLNRKNWNTCCVRATWKQQSQIIISYISHYSFWYKKKERALDLDWMNPRFPNWKRHPLNIWKVSILHNNNQFRCFLEKNYLEYPDSRSDLLGRHICLNKVVTASKRKLDFPHLANYILNEDICKVTLEVGFWSFTGRFKE